MRFLSSKLITSTLVLVTGFGLSTLAKAETIGNPVVNDAGFYSQVDGDPNDAYILNNVFASAGETVTSFSFYAKHSGSITPVLLNLSGGVFTVIGVGATDSNVGSGVFTYNFGTASGSAVTGANTYFGFVNSGSSNVGFNYTDGDMTNYTGNGGALQATSTDLISYLVGPPSSNDFTFIPVGAAGSNTVGGPGYREYAIDATAVAPSAVPEPSSLALLGTGILGLVGAGRRKFSKS